MLKDNLMMLRNIHGLSQEAVAEKIGISRQAYAKWETGATIPDVEKCALLAKLYKTTVDGLLKTEKAEGLIIPPAPEGRHIWGTVVMGDRGQIVIPKGARDQFGLSGGQRLVVLSDENGIALMSDEAFMNRMKAAMDYINRQTKPI